MPRYESVYAPTNSKKDRRFCCKFTYLFVVPKQGGGRGFAVSRKRESYGNNLPLGQIDERRHLMVFGKSMSGLCRVTSPFTPPPIAKKTGDFALYSFIRTIKPGAVEALPFPASGSPTAKICPRAN